MTIVEYLKKESEMKVLDMNQVQEINGGLGTAIKIVTLIAAVYASSYAGGQKNGVDKANRDNATGNQQCTYN